MRLLTEKKAAHKLDCSVFKLQKDRCRGDNSIPYIKIGRNVRYREDDVDEYLKNQTFSNTSQY